MVTLYQKLLRDLLRSKLALFTVLGITCLGVGTFVAMTSCYRTLTASESRYYREHRLPDAYLDLERIPESYISELRNDPAIRTVRGRIRESVQVFLRGQSHPTSGMAFSLPAPRRPVLADVSLKSGLWFSGPEALEVQLNEQFAEAHNLNAGDTIRVLIRGALRELLIVGTVGDPEHTFLLPPGGGMAPDPANYAVLYLPRSLLAAAAGLHGSANQLLLELHDTRLPSLRATLARLENTLDSFGVHSGGPIRDWPAIQVLGDKIQGLWAIAIVLPCLFLSVAMFLLHVFLSRIVAQQRVALGTLRALGYSRHQVASHIAGFGLVAGGLGGFFGLLLGHGLYGQMLSLYAQFFKLPGLVTTIDPLLYGLGFFAALAAGLGGAVRAAQKAAHLEPAEAMRPPPPEKGAAIFLERWPSLWDPLPFSLQLVLRGIFRNPVRSFLSLFSTFLGTSLIFAVLCLLNSISFLMHHHFELTSHEDVTVSLRDPVSPSALRELYSLSGVSEGEGQLHIAVELQHGLHRKRLAIVGLSEGARLTTPLDEEGKPVSIPRRGLVLAKRLAEILNVKPGHSLTLRALRGDRRTIKAPVVTVVDVYVGLSAWADRDYLSRLLGEHDVANTALLEIETAVPSEELLEVARRSPGITSLSERRRSLQLFHKTVGEVQQTSLSFLVCIAGFLAFASVLNNLLVSLDERQREVGTLRTLGYTNGQVSRIFASEALVLGGTGILLGLLGGQSLASALSTAFDTELYRFPVLLTPQAVFLSVVVMSLFLAAAQVILHILITRLDWLEALKVKE